jgi:hypothetical protein
MRPALKGPAIALVVLVAGCGGGGESGSPPTAPAPEPPTAGGVWASGVGAESLSLYIAEDGDLRFAGPDLSFGVGTVTVSASGQLSGSLRRVLRPPIANPFPSVIPGATVTGRPEEQACAITGTATARASLRATFACTTAAGAPVTQAYDFAYVASAHVRPPSPAGLAGNYTLPFRPASNMLNVNANGEVFAMYDNGARCTVNGRFSGIDPRFNLYRAEWTFSACAVPDSQRLEGVTFTGFAQRTTSFATPGAVSFSAIYVLLTAVVQGQLSSISVVYEPT